jgi:hypothetical protein
MLPYRDSKAQGAADFYFAINATFRFLQSRFGIEKLVKYWIELGESSYFQPVAENWRNHGLPAIAEYWRDFFQAEPNASVDVTCSEQRVLLEVKQCPAIYHLRKNSRCIVSEFCQHCFYVSDALASRAGFEVRIKGGNGTCEQTFAKRGSSGPQDLGSIRMADSP